MHDFDFHVVLEADPDGGWLVRCKDLPELLTAGDTQDEALSEARDALGLVLLTYLHESRPIPAVRSRVGHRVSPAPAYATEIADVVHTIEAA